MIVVPAPPGYELLRVWWDEEIDRLPVLAFLVDPANPHAPPSLVTATGRESDEASYTYVLALPNGTHAVPGSESFLHKKLDVLVADLIREHEAKKALKRPA